jgi:PIN domain nuclease of toxin-antitoxin system
MKLLLDTHAFLWFIMGDTRLTPTARMAIEDVGNDKFVSAASAWEMAVKVGLGKLQLSEPFDILIPREMRSNGFLYLPIDLAHTVRVVSLPFHHRDPFDRMLVAQVLCEQIALVSADVPLDAYGIQRIW